MKHALVLVDIQNDFLPGGALAVPDGDHVIPVANQLMDRFDIVIATQDWHPANHGSFASQHAGASVGDVVELNGLSQVLWPDHCVQGTIGADFASNLSLPANVGVFQKGTDRSVDSYSGFFDNGHRKDTGLAEHLKSQDVDHVVLLGLATDYCVKFTALDAREAGFEVTLVEDGCRGVNLHSQDVRGALDEMQQAGVKIVQHNALSFRS